jgi:hypothetical protein
MRIKYIFVLIVLLYTINQPILANAQNTAAQTVEQHIEQKIDKKWFFDWGVNLSNPDKYFILYYGYFYIIPFIVADLSLGYKYNNWSYGVNLGMNQFYYKLVSFHEQYLNIKTTYTFINSNNFKMYTGGG